MNEPDLIRLWRSCPLDEPPYLLPEDGPYIPEKLRCEYTTFSEYVESAEFRNPNDKKFHIGLLPGPYAGDILNARIYVLMLNGGLQPIDYYAESSNEQFVRAKKQDLQQQELDVEYPFFPLNPKFAWWPGYGYWEKRLAQHRHLLMDEFGLSYNDAVRFLSKSIACIQLVPYHSKAFGANSLLKQLPSAIAAREFVHEYLVPKAQKDAATIIVTRQVKYWGLPRHRNIVLYDRHESRGAHVGPTTRGGKAIESRLRAILRNASV